MADSYKVNRTGLIYDPLMLDFHCLWDEQYPEKPDRIKKPYERCEFYGLTKKCVSLPVTNKFITKNKLIAFLNQVVFKRADTAQTKRWKKATRPE